MNLPAGRLRHRVDLFEVTTAQDPATGDMSEQEVPFASEVPAEFTPLSARDFIAAQASQAQVSARVRIRYRAGVHSQMRLRFRGITYNVEGPPLPDPESGYEYLTLMCAEVTT